MCSLRRKPPRLGDVFQSGSAPLYFVTAVTWRRQRLLANRDAQEAFIERAQRQTEHGIAVGRYVLMPDHMHLFIRIGYEAILSETVKHLKQSITKSLRLKEPALRVWQPGFFDHLLRGTESYGEKWRYVRDNPVRAGLVDSADAWPFQGEIVPIDRV